MLDSSVLEKRSAARAAKAVGDSALLELHLRAAKALADAAAAPAVRAQAMAVVQRWADNQLCDMAYVHAWRRVLAMEPGRSAAAMLGTDAAAVALRQNTPFGFLMASAAAVEP